MGSQQNEGARSGTSGAASAPVAEGDSIASLRQRSIALFEARRLGEAETICRQILACQAASFDALLMLGAIEVQRGRMAQAAGYFRQAVAANGASAYAAHNLGVVELALLRPLEAVASFDRAIALQPRSAGAYFCRGTALCMLGRHAEALESFDAAIAREARDWRPHAERGRALCQLGRLPEALQSYDRAIALSPNIALCHCLRGEVLLELARSQEALASCDRALALDRTLAQAHIARAAALRACSRLADALAAADRAIGLQPSNADAHVARGLTLIALERHEEALTAFRSALDAAPDHALAHWHTGECLRRLDRPAEALAAWERVQQLQPTSAATMAARGLMLNELRRFDEALRCYRAALAAAPDNATAAFNAGCCLLKLGQFAEGWKLFEARPRFEPPDRDRIQRQPRWSGSVDLRGRRLLVTAEGGLGDAIQFSRYVSSAAHAGACVILEAHPPLRGLLSSVAGVDALICPGEELPPFDLHCPVMSLPFAFDTTLATIPAAVPYLKVDADRVSHWAARLPPRTRPRVGIVWSSGVRPQHPDLWLHERRNIPLASLAVLLDLDIELYSLQKGRAQSQLAHLPRNARAARPIIDHADHLHDFTDTAALMQNLDLIISVDTAAAHLAGALAKPTWILLGYDACWRWLLDRSDSPWYPTARLYRQERPGDWSGVVAKLAADLGRL